ncbi:hypothetical protein Ocin01_17316 [Orchesella cincta]|uniref:Uncharacterized protein n=1 Tax=Orchesella cincta TaxID=48709 RepID=A0A1D2M8Q3_ORCCI|nr:hypothetical protein Ocin01_17316 [Orchesella cincta]
MNMAANTASGPIQLASQYRIDTPETINDMEMRPLTSAPEDDFHSTLINGCSCNYHIGETLAKLKRQRAPAQNCNGSTEQIQRSTDVPDCLQRPCDIISPPESTERTVVRLKKVDDWAEVFRSYWPQLVQKTNNNKGLVLSQAIQNKPVLLNAFLTMLNNCIFFQQENPTQGTLIGIDLKFLLEKLEVKSNFRESYVLDHLIKELEDSDSKNRILAHPLVKTVATLKCQKHKLLSKIAVGFHTLFAFLFTICTFITLWKHPFVLTVTPNILNGIHWGGP